MGMSYSDMKKVIEGGGSVLHEGRLHTSVATLPSKSTLAKTDDEKKAAADDIAKRRAELDAEEAALLSKSGKSGSAKKESAPALTADELMKKTRDELVKDADAVKEKTGEEFEADATKAVLVKFILDNSKAEESE